MLRKAVLLFLLLLVACGEEEPVPTATAAVPILTLPPTATPTEVPPTATPEPTDVPPTATPTETPEPIRPKIEASAQTVTEDGLIIIDHVTATEAGWLVLFGNDNEVHGTVALSEGMHSEIEMSVEPIRLDENAQFVLFSGGTDAPFDLALYTPVSMDGETVSADVQITLDITEPTVQASDQEVLEDGVIVLDGFVAREDGWLAVYNDADGDLGERVGLSYVRAGVASDYPIELLWRVATPTLHIVLHEDQGEIGRFDPADPIVTFRNDPVQATISARYPVNISILDQPVLDGKLIIDRVVTYEPTWVVVYFANDNDTPGNIIGSGLFEPGIHENVAVEILSRSVTDILFVQLHIDNNDMGDFEYPLFDPPIQYLNQPRFFEVAANPGNYVVSMDQSLRIDGGRAYVTVPLAVGDIPMWVVIRAHNTDLAHDLGEVIGYEFVPVGINRDIEIEVDAEKVTSILHAGLHIDRDGLEIFEFPDGRDFELQRRQAPIEAPFFLLDQ